MSLIDAGTRTSSSSAYAEKRFDWTWPGVTWELEDYKEGAVFSANAIEFVPVAMALLSLCEADPEPSIVKGVMFGRGADTIPKVTGNVAGALKGASALSAEWIERVETANREFFEAASDDPARNFRWTAEQLVGVPENERDAASKRAAQLDAMPG